MLLSVELTQFYQYLPSPLSFLVHFVLQHKPSLISQGFAHKCNNIW